MLLNLNAVMSIIANVPAAIASTVCGKVHKCTHEALTLCLVYRSLRAGLSDA